MPGNSNSNISTSNQSNDARNSNFLIKLYNYKYLLYENVYALRSFCHLNAQYSNMAKNWCAKKSKQTMCCVICDKLFLTRTLTQCGW